MLQLSMKRKTRTPYTSNNKATEQGKYVLIHKKAERREEKNAKGRNLLEQDFLPTTKSKKANSPEKCFVFIDVCTTSVCQWRKKIHIPYPSRCFLSFFSRLFTVPSLSSKKKEDVFADFDFAGDGEWLLLAFFLSEYVESFRGFHFLRLYKMWDEFLNSPFGFKHIAWWGIYHQS